MVRSLLLGPLLVLGCEGESGTKPADAPAPATLSGPVAPVEPKAPPPAAPDLTPLVLPKAVPAAVAAVVTMRSATSLVEAWMTLDPVVGGDKHIEAMVAEVDALVASRYGIHLTAIDQVTGFVLPGEPKFAVAFTKVEGELAALGTSVGEFDGVALFEFEGAVAAVVDASLVVGDREAVEAAIGAAQGKAPRLAEAGGALVEMLTKHGAGAAFGLAFATASLPDDVRGPLSKQGVTHGSATFGSTGLVVVARGEESKLSTLSAQFDGLFALGRMGLAELEAKSKGGDEFAEQIGLIVAKHSLNRYEELLDPKLEDGELVLRVPLRGGSAAAFVPIVGVLAAIAVPAFTKYMRRAKTSEARVQLAKMFDGASAYLNEEHTTTEIQADGSITTTTTQYQCPTGGVVAGEAGMTPPLAVDCNDGPSGRCTPSVGGKAPGGYDLALWTDNQVWRALNMQLEQAHYFHYNFKYANTPGEFGGCQFTAQAFGDLDGDGVFSTYERAGAADRHGVNAAAGLYIDNETE